MKPGVRIWLALIRMARRKAIAADLVQRRRVAEEARRQAFHGPPLTPEQVEAGYAAVEAERNG
jgi:hypothetical protein